MNPNAQIAANLITIGLCMAGLAIQAGDPFTLLEAMAMIVTAEAVLAV